MKPLFSIQILRAVAALGVLAFHVCQWSGADFAVGAAGVDLFFLVSGFVLWLAAERQPVSAGAFLWARAARITPLYWLWTLLATGLALAWPVAAPVVHPEPWHVMQSLAFIPHNDPAGQPFPLLPSGWTLVYEAFFYLAFALALTQAKALRFRILAAILGAGAVMGLAYPPLYTLLANAQLLEFVAGAALARAWLAGGLGGVGGRAAGWAAIAAGAALLALQQGLNLRSDLWRPLLWGVPAFLILIGSLKLEASGLRPGPVGRALVPLGDASYSLYLCQIPVVLVVLALTPGVAAPLRMALTVALALVVGLACHAWIERPLARALRRGPRSGLMAPVRAGT